MKTRTLILNANDGLEKMLYTKFKEEHNFWVLGTYNASIKNDELIKLKLNDSMEVQIFLEHFIPDVVIWNVIDREKENINEQLTNILNYLSDACKIVFIDENKSIDAESLIRKRENYIIIKTEAAFYNLSDSYNRKVEQFSEKILELVKTNYNGILDIQFKK